MLETQLCFKKCAQIIISVHLITSVQFTHVYANHHDNHMMILNHRHHICWCIWKIIS